MEFYTIYVRLCNSIGKSPSAVAREIGIEKSTVSRWAKGGNPNKSTCVLIADYFHISYEDLMNGNIEKAPAQQEPKNVIPAQQEPEGVVVEEDSAFSFYYFHFNSQEAEEEWIIRNYRLADPQTKSNVRNTLAAVEINRRKGGGVAESSGSQQVG